MAKGPGDGGADNHWRTQQRFSAFASIPLMRGFPPGQCWHMAKTIECGAFITDPIPGVRTGLIGRLRRDHFLVEATHPLGACSTLRVASQILFENPSPYYQYEPSGMLDTSACRFIQETPRTVKVVGSSFVPAPRYTIKLEGAEHVGFRTITIAGTRDPTLIAKIDTYLEKVREAVCEEGMNQGFPPQEYNLLFRVYGKNGVMQNWEPQQGLTSHELAIIGECIAPNQEFSSAIMNMTHGALLHTPFDGCLCNAGNMAFPYSPHDIEMGPGLPI